MTRLAFLSPLSLSGRALGWFALVGILATLVTVPEAAGSGLWSWRWWLVASAAQGACTAVALALRPVVRAGGAVLAALALAGAARGAVIAWGGESLGLLADPSWPARVANSAVVTVIWLGLLGAVMRSARDYEQQYRTLVERAVTVERAARDGEPIDPAVLLSWSGVKARIDDATRLARSQLDAGSDGSSLASAAGVIRAAIDNDVRPASHALWGSSSAVEPPRLAGRALLLEALAPWRPPLVPILAALAAVVGVGTIVRLGLATAAPYTLAYLAVVAVMLAGSRWIAWRTGADRVVAIVTLALLPPVTFAVGDLASRLPGVERDLVGGVIVALQTPATSIVVTMLVRLLSERRAVLEALQRSIDAAAISQLATAARRSDDTAQLSTYVHHSVQSELAALAIQLSEAAQTQDPSVIDDVRTRVLERLGRIEAIDASQPPWLRASTGLERIREVAGAWDGIVDVSLVLPGPHDARPDQWHLAAQVVEEGVANAARHGGARRVRIESYADDGALVVSIDDDGRYADAPPGLGSNWLDTVAAGAWKRTPRDGGTRLEVRIA